MIKRGLLVILTMLSFAITPLTVVGAASPMTQMAVCGDGANNFFGIQPWYACLKQKNGDVSIRSINDIFLIIFPIVESLVKIGALVAAGIIFFMIIKMITARGNAGTIATAGEGIRDAVIGLIICIAAVAVVNFIAGGIVK